MNTPKILPWVARKAGITDDHAIKLWKGRGVSQISEVVFEHVGLRAVQDGYAARPTIPRARVWQHGPRTPYSTNPNNPAPEEQYL